MEKKLEDATQTTDYMIPSHDQAIRCLSPFGHGLLPLISFITLGQLTLEQIMGFGLPTHGKCPLMVPSY